MMHDPAQLLQEDHRAVEALFSQYADLESDNVADKRRLVTEITQALTRHAEMEETLCYPRFTEVVTDTDDEEMISEAYAEHASVKAQLAELESLDPGSEEFDDKVTSLIDDVQHHVQEEEEELLPLIEQFMPDEEWAELGNELAAFKASRGVADTE